MFGESDIQRATAAYNALGEYAFRIDQVAAKPGAPPARRDLTAYELKVFSQNGEDGVLVEILRRIGTTNEFFVEFGVESGREGSCVALADIAGWHGLFMEADPSYHHLLHQKYQWSARVTTLHTMVSPDNVDDLFATAGVPPEPDIVSIDVDGADYWIWRGLQMFRPRVVAIEYNASIDPSQRLVQPPDAGAWDGTAYYGASLGALVALGESKGYRLVHCELAGVNAFFVRADLAGDFAAPDEVARRGPNYLLTSYGHPPDTTGRAYVEV